jgi:DNA polymerase III alpha subunit
LPPTLLNPERPDPPDIDLDLCWRRRDEVLAYVYETYGADHVAMIGTHIRFKLRSAWRDAARAHGLPPEQLEAMAHRPWGYDLDEARAEEADLGAEPVESAETADMEWGPLYPPTAETGLGVGLPASTLPGLDPQILAACAALEDQPRHLGIHCGGIGATRWLQKWSNHVVAA